MHTGPERRVRFEPGAVELAAGTGLRYRLLPQGREHLGVRATAVGAGALEARFAVVDLESGAPRPVGESREIALSAGGRLERGLLLPSAGPGELLQVDLLWRSPADAGLVLEALPLDGGPAHGGGGRALPPVIFVSIDTLAARHLSLYGYGRPTTPLLEELADEAVVFERCTANAPWTLPSYLSVMTGLYPEAHRLEPETQRGDGSKIWDRWQLAENRWALAEMFRALGYRTAAFVDTPWLSELYNLHQGFDLFDTSAEALPRSDSSGGFVYIAGEARRWLADNGDGEGGGRPPFLFLQAVDVHAPYLPLEPWRGRFGGELGPGDARPVKAGCTSFAYGALADYMVIENCPGGEIPEEMDVERIIALYDEEILALDAAFGDFVAALREDGLFEEALIVFTADHGEGFGPDHYGHGGVLNLSLIHI